MVPGRLRGLRVSSLIVAVLRRSVDCDGFSVQYISYLTCDRNTAAGLYVRASRDRSRVPECLDLAMPERSFQWSYWRPPPSWQFSVLRETTVNLERESSFTAARGHHIFDGVDLQEIELTSSWS